jgi:PadR family transcriptional regulator PadR
MRDVSSGVRQLGAVHIRQDAVPRRRSPPPDASANTPGQSPRELVVPYVLLAVSLQRAHGYAIEEYLRQVGLLGIEMSTLYRTLRQLEKDGLLRSSWEPGPAGPARRVYALTDVGTTWLDTWAATLSAYRGMIDRFFGLYTGSRRAARKT